MKQKFLMLLAVVLLSCASAFAQSGNNNPLKGDVNEDGDRWQIIFLCRNRKANIIVSSNYC